LLSACGASIKMAYVDASGKSGSGVTTVNGTLGDGNFSISDKGQTCRGEFKSWSNISVVFPVKCSNGLAGSVTMTRTAEGTIAGEGTMQLENGETRHIIFASRGKP
jgi:hypothetical protein